MPLTSLPGRPHTSTGPIIGWKVLVPGKDDGIFSPGPQTPATWGRWHLWGQGSLDLGPTVPPSEAVLPTLSCRGGAQPAWPLPPPHTPRARGLRVQTHLRSCLQKNITKRVHLPLRRRNSHRQHQSQTERDRGDPRPSGDEMNERWLRFSGRASWGRRLETGLGTAQQLWKASLASLPPSHMHTTLDGVLLPGGLAGPYLGVWGGVRGPQSSLPCVL